MEKLFAQTPKPPYYAVLFTSKIMNASGAYDSLADKMLQLVSEQDGFLGYEAARDHLGITISYWKDLDAIKKWKNQIAHQKAQERGKKEFYEAYKVRIVKVLNDYEFFNSL